MKRIVFFVVFIIFLFAFLMSDFAAVRRPRFYHVTKEEKKPPKETEQKTEEIKIDKKEVKKEIIHSVKENWDKISMWNVCSDGNSVFDIKEVPAYSGNGLEIKFTLKGGHGWIQLNKKVEKTPPEDIPVTFLIKADTDSDLELKFIDKSGATFLRKVSLKGKYRDWSPVVYYKKNIEYCWGGTEDYDGLSEVSLAISGKGRGTVWLDEIGFGEKGLSTELPLAGPQLDTDRELPGIGFRQRRSAQLILEDPLVLEWLKQIQDISSPEQQLLPSMGGNQAQTFNNSLVAMAFILKGERERAERILDFFAYATVRKNWCPALQNFFYKEEPRGFFQYVTLNPEGNLPAYHNPGKSDRWMGDLSWLLTAYKYYEKAYNSDKYREIADLLKDLLISWYKDDGDGGYVQHGWRKGDSRLHEPFGHPEGNIDCYAVFKLCGEYEYADKIKKWLDRHLKGKSMPLDLYTWRVLAYGKDYVEVLNIPEYDLRYRKTLTVNGKKVAGFFHGPDINMNNIWLDGTGHIACAYIVIGDRERGYFYSNQLDAFLMDREINGVKTRSLPYTANKTGGYKWVRHNRGFASVAAWYIFAKNGFNPMTLERIPFDKLQIEK